MTKQDFHAAVLSSALAKNTRIAYKKGWSRFIDYCKEEHIPEPLSASPEEVARFLVQLATRPGRQTGTILSMGTVVLYKSAINKKYTDAGKASPDKSPCSQCQPQRTGPTQRYRTSPSKGTERISYPGHACTMCRHNYRTTRCSNDRHRFRRCSSTLRDMRPESRRR